MTEIAHQYSESVPIAKCLEEKCFRISFNYTNVNIDQIKALIRISENCRQLFRV